MFSIAQVASRVAILHHANCCVQSLTYSQVPAFVFADETSGAQKLSPSCVPNGEVGERERKCFYNIFKIYASSFPAATWWFLQERSYWSFGYKMNVRRWARLCCRNKLSQRRQWFNKRLCQNYIKYIAIQVRLQSSSSEVPVG